MVNMDANITDANNTLSIACPLADRRSNAGVLVKLFVVHFTTIAAFCHLLSIRSERVVSYKLIFYFLVPLNIFIYLGLAFATYVVALIQWYLTSDLERRTVLKRAPRWLFGIIPDEKRVHYISMVDWDTFSQSDQGQSRWKTTGRFVIAIAFLVQCIGTIVLYARRHVHGAVTLADQRVFELGCGGIVTASLWLLTLSSISPFNQLVPNVETEERTRLEDIMVLLRDVQSEPIHDPSVDDVCLLLKNGATSFFVLIIQGEFALVPGLKDFFTGKLLQDNNTGPYWAFYTLVMAACLSWLFVWFEISDESDEKAAKRSGTQDRLHADQNRKPAWQRPKIYLIAVLGWLPALLVLGVVAVPVICIVTWVKIAVELAHLEHVPLNATCPLLWSDPVADWLWALA